MTQRDKEIEAEQAEIIKEIERLRKRINELEAEKSPKSRTLKYRLQARAH